MPRKKATKRAGGDGTPARRTEKDTRGRVEILKTPGPCVVCGTKRTLLLMAGKGGEIRICRICASRITLHHRAML